MLPAVRKREIVELVSEQGECSVAELAEEMDCSKATIRRDLSALEDRQLIERSHGGAVPVTTVGKEQTYGQKEVQNLNGKMRIAERAAEEITDNQVVFFDSGSTTMQVAKNAPDDRSFLAVTNSPVLAIELGKQVDNVKLTGGSLRHETRALTGPSAERFMERTNFDLLFLGTNAIGPSEGLMTPNEGEARLKSLMIENAGRVVLVSDGSKLGKQSFVKFSSLDDIDTFITDTELSSEQHETFETADVEVIQEVEQ
ncbi:HTH-type transcriptional regulator GlpR [Halocatena salina]|uniref:DeoR/GlpR family DNA-binding transcription regulator n=1 Tax=Halocatena salina TaxID=2934340 RepID=A0A8U0A748_9EURY|nr:HTH-type transcriptional regulator GlpR [Halocatena salina]UPM44676.1 DeoR/GlpR family DNA-binding transcription regulator [Halocatena salina]